MYIAQELGLTEAMGFLIFLAKFKVQFLYPKHLREI